MNNLATCTPSDKECFENAIKQCEPTTKSTKTYISIYTKLHAPKIFSSQHL